MHAQKSVSEVAEADGSIAGYIIGKVEGAGAKCPVSELWQ